MHSYADRYRQTHGHIHNTQTTDIPFLPLLLLRQSLTGCVQVNLMASMTSCLQDSPARPLRSTKEDWNYTVFCQPKAGHLRRCSDGCKHNPLMLPSSQLCCCTGNVRIAAHHLRDDFFMPALRQKRKLSQGKKNKLIFCAHLGVWPEIHITYLGTKTYQRHTNILPWKNVPASLSDGSTGLSLDLDETQILIQ